METKYFETTIEIPEKCSVDIKNRLITVKGPKGEVTKEIKTKLLRFENNNNKITIFSTQNRKESKKLVSTFVAIIKNMLKGVTEGHVYKLKICSGHFPMSVSVKNNVLEIKNFIGESKPRTLKLNENVTVKVNGQEITVEGINKELVGQTAASIEQKTRRPNFDRRIFQDGIYIIEKDGKKI